MSVSPISTLRRRKGPNLTIAVDKIAAAPTEFTEKPETLQFDSVKVDEDANIILDESSLIQELNAEDDRAPLAGEAGKKEPDLPKQLGVWEFVKMELTRGYSLETHQDRYTEKRRKVYAFFRIPYELEKFLFFGFLHCLDAFANVFTFLPIRLLLAVIGRIFGTRVWTAAETCDLLKISIIITASLIMQLVDTSMLYHIVRGQGVIKLYIFYNMLEVADKLFSSFGQDILEALFWTASERGGKRKVASTFVQWCATVLYALLHALLVLLQATTLNVAFNSHNQSLLTIMMSNNFVELKGAVFKKFAKPNLFQMSCSDCRERFHTVILLIVVVLRNMTAVNWKLEHLSEMVPDLFMVFVAELIVDWLKHAFITKFNEISAEVYQDFTITLSFDVVRSHEEETFTDFSDVVSRRMGFIPVPIAIMLIRVISQSIDFSTNVYVLVFALVWVSLLFIKVVNGVFLNSKSVQHVQQFRKLQHQAESEFYRRRVLSAKSKSVPNSPRISLIDFSDILTQATRVPPKGFTVSDMLAELGQISDQPTSSDSPKPPKSSPQEETPRRSMSVVDLTTQSNKRDKSLPPLIETEENAKERDEEKGQPSPKRRVNDCEQLSDVLAYQLLNGSDNAQEIRS
ncbi:unnamed protein product [Bursaphelenchus xylophilus]|uniref:(pine wood nematode) hypothetical protein n=1 Tax=Bursaphelenchus xylophilus TaxID=6326 RepID=A0A1I7S2P6_BURXY|nr:unnamed protein product [Bursaphelenchus xylophilus]CAG9121758.1 unnamed protein product [Bursaphelenchus xylophilus]